MVPARNVSWIRNTRGNLGKVSSAIGSL
jgi:hypothetical protein